MILKVQNISGGYHSENIVENISFSVSKGEILGILGPNGSGKTTLMKILSGLITPRTGEILLNDQLLSTYSSKQLAREIAVLAQSSDTSFSYLVRDIVALGRYPHQKGFFKGNTSNDEEIIKQAMLQTKVDCFQDKYMHELSGGEQQRVLLARALAQQPKLLLLDEPTNHLDISFQMSLLNMLKDWAKKNSLTVVAILHDLNMASLYCDRLLLLHEGKQVCLDRPSLVMNEEQLENVYQTPLKRKEHPVVPKPLITLLPKNDIDTKTTILDRFSISQSNELILIESSVQLKTLSSAVLGAGFSWERTFINRHVNKDYNCDDPVLEYRQFLANKKIDYSEAVGMMTAAKLEDASFVKKQENKFTVFVMVTAGLSNAVDVSKAYYQGANESKVGTINTWVFIEGYLTEAAFVQAMMTATEAKVKALHDEIVLDLNTKTIATGTSTDSIMIAATQTGESMPYAGTITPLGKTIGLAVYEATVAAVKKNKRRLLCQ